MLVAAWIAFLLVMLFVLGSAVGSFLNVCIVRLPQGRSLIRPPSSCGHCGKLIRMRDNLPLLSYWLLRGRCRACGAPFSMRYFWVELLTGLLFVAIYHFEIGWNVHRFELWDWYEDGYGFLEVGMFPPRSWPLFAVRAVMVGFLIVAAMSAYEWHRVPWTVTGLGIALGLTAAVLCPWPWPDSADRAIGDSFGRSDPLRRAQKLYAAGPHVGAMPAEGPWWKGEVAPQAGLYAWPVWGPLPDRLAPGSRALGLATGVAGALVGAILGAAARVAFNAGTGAATASWGETSLLAIAGAFLGWQPIVTAALIGLVPGLLAAALRWRGGRRPQVSFGLWLMAALVPVWLGWYWIGPRVQRYLFDRIQVLLLAADYGAALLLLAVGLRLMRGSKESP